MLQTIIGLQTPIRLADSQEGEEFAMVQMTKGGAAEFQTGKLSEIEIGRNDFRTLGQKRQ